MSAVKDEDSRKAGSTEDSGYWLTLVAASVSGLVLGLLVTVAGARAYPLPLLVYLSGLFLLGAFFGKKLGRDPGELTVSILFLQGVVLTISGIQGGEETNMWGVGLLLLLLCSVPVFLGVWFGIRSRTRKPDS